MIPAVFTGEGLPSPPGESPFGETRKPDTVVISFPTVVDIVVDLRTGETKQEYEAPDLAKPICATAWAEGELLGESDDGTQSGFVHGEDREAYLQAMKVISRARLYESAAQ